MTTDNKRHLSLWSLGVFIGLNALLYIVNDWPSSELEAGTMPQMWANRYLLVTALFLGLLAAYYIRPKRPLEGLPTRHLPALVVAAFYGITLIALMRRAHSLGWPMEAVILQVLALGGLPLLLWSLHKRHLLGVLLVVGLVLRVAAFSYTPLEAETADMLPLIENAHASFLSGATPYRTYEIHAWPLPLTYLPMMWLAYLPSTLLGFDIRLINAAADVVMLVALWAALPPERRIYAVLLYLSPIVIIFGIYTEFPIFWMMAALLFYALSQQKWLLAMIVWGLALCTSLLTLVFSPFIAFYVLKNQPFWQSVKLGSVPAAVTAGIIAPFLLWNPETFLYGTWEFFNDLSVAGYGMWAFSGKPQLYQIGFGGWFWLLGIEATLKPVQTALVLSATAFYVLRCDGSFRALMRVILPTYVGFIMFNPIIWPYFYVPVLLLLAFIPVEAPPESGALD